MKKEKNCLYSKVISELKQRQAAREQQALQQPIPKAADSVKVVSNHTD